MQGCPAGQALQDDAGMRSRALLVHCYRDRYDQAFQVCCRFCLILTTLLDFEAQPFGISKDDVQTRAGEIGSLLVASDEQNQTAANTTDNDDENDNEEELYDAQA